jgi:hypothetical protein
MHGSFPVDGVPIADHVAYCPDADEGQKYDEMEHARYIRSCIACTTPGTLLPGNLSFRRGDRARPFLPPPLKIDSGLAANACSDASRFQHFLKMIAGRRRQESCRALWPHERPLIMLRPVRMPSSMESLSCTIRILIDGRPAVSPIYCHHKGTCRFSLLTISFAGGQLARAHRPNAQNLPGGEPNARGAAVALSLGRPETTWAKN